MPSTVIGGSGYASRSSNSKPLITNLQQQIWEFFLAYSTIISRQGSATCYQITLVKNINSTHRVEGIPSQFGLQAALAASKVNTAAHKARNMAGGLEAKVRNVLKSDDN